MAGGEIQAEADAQEDESTEGFPESTEIILLFAK